MAARGCDGRHVAAVTAPPAVIFAPPVHIPATWKVRGKSSLLTHCICRAPLPPMRWARTPALSDDECCRTWCSGTGTRCLSHQASQYRARPAVLTAHACHDHSYQCFASSSANSRNNCCCLADSLAGFTTLQQHHNTVVHLVSPPSGAVKAGAQHCKTGYSNCYSKTEGVSGVP